jgi:nucleoside-triphosphatase
MGRTVLLTGRPGVGKTTIIRRIAERLGDDAGGFYTTEIRESGRRQGFRIVTLDGEEGILSHLDIKGTPRVSRYGVNLRDLEETAVTALRRAIADADCILIDEIGTMELFSEEFRRTVSQAIDCEKAVLATVMASQDSWVDALKALPQVTVLEVTRDNREQMVPLVMGLLQDPS